MINLWPEEESGPSKLKDVFDEAMTPRRTGEELMQRLRELVPLVKRLPGLSDEHRRLIERLERRWEMEVLMNGANPGRARQ